MGLFNFIKKVSTGVVKTALTPIAIVEDIVTGDTELSKTSDNINDALQDISESLDEE